MHPTSRGGEASLMKKVLCRGIIDDNVRLAGGEYEDDGGGDAATSHSHCIAYWSGPTVRHQGKDEVVGTGLKYGRGLVQHPSTDQPRPTGRAAMGPVIVEQH